MVFGSSWGLAANELLNFCEALVHWLSLSGESKVAELGNYGTTFRVAHLDSPDPCLSENFVQLPNAGEGNNERAQNQGHASLVRTGVNGCGLDNVHGVPPYGVFLMGWLVNTIITPHQVASQTVLGKISCGFACQVLAGTFCVLFNNFSN